jgi:hypothetical protein
MGSISKKCAQLALVNISQSEWGRSRKDGQGTKERFRLRYESFPGFTMLIKKRLDRSWDDVLSLAPARPSRTWILEYQ